MFLMFIPLCILLSFVIVYPRVIENGNSWVNVPQTAQENGTSVMEMFVPVTAEEKTNKKNDVKARSLLLMALLNEHQLTFSQYPDAKTMFAAIKTRFGGVVISQEELNSKFLSGLPPEWNTHVVVWMNKPEIKTMSIDNLYNNLKIVEQKVKKSVGASSGAQIMDFMTTLSTSSTNHVNTAMPAYEVGTASPDVNTACPQVSTASFSDNVVYTFMVENPNGSNLLHQDLKQIHEDDLEVMNLKWKLSLLSMRAKRYYQRTCKKIFINANDTAGYDKSKVECFNCHKMGHFSREYRAPRSKEGHFRYQNNTRKQGNNEDTSSKVMLPIDGVGFDWSDMAEEQVQTNMALMTFSDSELNQTKFTAATYKRILATVEEQLITYRKNEVLFSEEVAVLKREVACKDYEINVLKSVTNQVCLSKMGLPHANGPVVVNVMSSLAPKNRHGLDISYDKIWAGYQGLEYGRYSLECGVLPSSGYDVSDLVSFVVFGSGYQQKDRKPSQNDKTEHGMEKTVQNQGQSILDCACFEAIKAHKLCYLLKEITGKAWKQLCL
ncbi:putative ribonuclease H-like domain-containing protein [Tanacetum coccineum]